SALDQEYLQKHGIGAIIVNGPTKTAASQQPYLTRIRSGTWDVYLVNSPTSIVTISGNAPQAVDIGNQSISATGTADGGEIMIRRNWFPPWKATINGKPIAIQQTDDGYMAIAAPSSGVIQLELTYSVDWLDWLGRIGAVLGAIIVVLMLLPDR